MDETTRQAAIALHDRFTHVHHDRRAFMAEMTRLAGGTAAAVALAAAIGADPAAAAIVAADDPRLASQRIEWAGAGGHRMAGLSVRAKEGAAKRPAVIVIHENRGLTPYIEDVARRVALAGFQALAPDFLTPAGGTPADEDKAREMIGALDMPATVADAVATARFAATMPGTTGRVGAVGFCWGGAMVNRLAVGAGSGLAAGIAYYGPPPPPSEAAKVKAAMMLHYAGLDERVNAGADAWVVALKAAGVDVVRHDYPGKNHAFHNDTSAARYDREAADLSWDRTIAFLKAHLV
ncbi:MAG: dienelactone hydrolase family protein [Sphingomonas fennica]